MCLSFCLQILYGWLYLDFKHSDLKMCLSFCLQMLCGWLYLDFKHSDLKMCLSFCLQMLCGCLHLHSKHSDLKMCIFFVCKQCMVGCIYILNTVTWKCAYFLFANIVWLFLSPFQTQWLENMRIFLSANSVGCFYLHFKHSDLKMCTFFSTHKACKIRNTSTTKTWNGCSNSHLACM